jgi:hypothetical protein
MSEESNKRIKEAEKAEKKIASPSKTLEDYSPDDAVFTRLAQYHQSVSNTFGDARPLKRRLSSPP